MNPDLSLTLAGAFVMGLMTSVHCVGMCGPLACMACQRAGSCSASQTAATYQVGRLLSYTTVGVLAGTFGGTLGSWLPPQTAQVLFWIIGLTTIGFALSWTFGWKLPVMRPGKLTITGPAAPGIMGLATPLIPCGPLYLVFAACALTASPVRGASLALAFGLGTLPLLWVAQHQWWRVQRWLGIRGAGILQRGIVLIAAFIVLWRLHSGEGFTSPDCCSTALFP